MEKSLECPCMINLEIKAEESLPTLTTRQECVLGVKDTDQFRYITIYFYDDTYDMYYNPEKESDLVARIKLQVGMYPPMYDADTIFEVAACGVELDERCYERELETPYVEIYKMLTKQFKKDGKEEPDDVITMINLQELYVSPKFRHKGVAQFIMLRLPWFLHFYLNIGFTGYIGTFIKPYKNQEDFDKDGNINTERVSATWKDPEFEERMRKTLLNVGFKKAKNKSPRYLYANIQDIASVASNLYDGKEIGLTY